MTSIWRCFVCLFACTLVAACGTTTPEPERETLRLKAVSYSDLPGWDSDRHDKALVAFTKSCERILKRSPHSRFGPMDQAGTYGDWQSACRDVQSTSPREAKAFFERWFSPWAVTTARRKTDGLFTGYYEASLHGSLDRHGPYQFPLYKRPDDLVMVDLGEFRESMKGERIAGRVKSGRLRPYEDRGAIVQGVTDGAEREVLVWVDDPVDAFFVQIQGSGLVTLPNGKALRVGYAGQNGHPYFAIGRALVHQDEIPKEKISMQSIRAWLDDNPDRAADLMNMNKSYVFFRVLEEAGPLGAEGVPLAAGRSLAVDRTYLPYGAPVWLATEPVIDNAPPLQRLMVAQDTGGAIRGVVRGDVFWGYGPKAERLAGSMKAEGRYWILLPRDSRSEDVAFLSSSE